MTEVKAGTLLISDPFLQDPNFMRSVVLICEHDENGSFGLVLNRKYNTTLGSLFKKLIDCDYPVFYGGPVQPDTLHFIHSVPHLIEESIDIGHGIFWGGDVESIFENIQNGKIKSGDIRFFVGYSGWDEGQLNAELSSRSWILKAARKNLVFHAEPDTIWKEALKDMGGEYQQMVNYPIDPQLN